MRRRRRPWGAVFLARRKADISRLPGDFALDVVKRTDTVQRLAGDGRFGFVPFIVKVASQMRPACRFAQPGCSIRVWIIELGIAFIAIRLQDAAGLGQVAMDVFLFPIWGEGIDRARGRGTSPRPLIPD